ncbi:phosphatase PAP2 family protein [Burkholderia sp. LMG 32019]|uniref:phosphatase PAP2 family protein n=1 Tax=Burkholderia sp. LMG 32019 TaxID=3158173 RepID=UPI003C2DCF0D
MHTSDYFINLVLSAILIVGAYQFYFWCQRNAVRSARYFTFRVDEAIPYRPQWVWIYSFLYYPAILYLNLLAPNPAAFTRMAISFIFLLAIQMLFFVIFPVETPNHWREFNQGGTSEQFLRYVRKFDAASNCFPSMHTSVAMLTALFALPAVGPLAYAFPLLIALSCLFTKQHYLIDLPSGAALGWLAFQFYGLLQS